MAVAPVVGSVTSVDVSVPSFLQSSGGPITSHGTIALSIRQQSGNLFFASAADGSLGIPGFRSLVSSDFGYQSTGDMLYGAGSPLTNPAIRIPIGTNAQVLTIVGGVPSWADHPNVTSVALAMPSIFSVSGSPVTNSGTLTATLNTQSSGLVFAGPATGSPAAPGFRALAVSDIPTLASLYLPLSGGTLTGILNGTSAIFSGALNAATASFSGALSAGSLTMGGGIQLFTNTVSSNYNLV